MTFRVQFIKGDVAQQFQHLYLEGKLCLSNNSVSPSMRQKQKERKIYGLAFALIIHLFFLTLIKNVFLI